MKPILSLHKAHMAPINLPLVIFHHTTPSKFPLTLRTSPTLAKNICSNTLFRAFMMNPRSFSMSLVELLITTIDIWSSAQAQGCA
ncbi:unnamed protein product [Moneuplotes crassus]|uniref:Uncharacterized protein n=1 Tax=Euplotes crassus TaxID=5936 RepID=A0AAD1Y4V9_EUPCR|nr:unnamed protein product [Moneuplotes crassus]